MTLEAVPPGTQPSSTRPTAIWAQASGPPTPVTLRSLATSQPKPAMHTYWLQMPTSTSPGRRRIRAKSSARSVRPMPNMMTPSSRFTKPREEKCCPMKGTQLRSRFTLPARFTQKDGTTSANSATSTDRRARFLFSTSAKRLTVFIDVSPLLTPQNHFSAASSARPAASASRMACMKASLVTG